MSALRHSLAFALFALAAPILAAGGGGGGGGGSMPSQSAPQYDPAVEYQKGVKALDAKDFKGAKSAFDRVIAVAPKDANTQYLAGVARMGLSDWKGARRNLERAARLAPELIRAWRDLGIVQARLGDTVKAGETLAGIKAKAAACATTCPQSTELADAAKAVETALTGAPVAMIDLPASPNVGDARYLGAVALINERRYEAAIAELRLAQASFGPHPDILTYLGFANRKLKRFDAAEAYYRQALAIAPDHRGATEYFGELMVERRDFAGARQMLARLDRVCRFGCAEAEELRAWIGAGRSPHSS